MTKKKSSKETFELGARAVEVYKRSVELATKIGTSPTSQATIETIMVDFNESKCVPPLDEAELMSHVTRAISYVAGNSLGDIKNDKKTHTVKEVDRLEAEGVIEGFCIAYDAMEETLDRMMRGIDETMSVYMRDDLNRYKNKVEELSLMYTVLQAVAEKYEGIHYEKLQQLKSDLNLDDN
jgi:hypothetical protein